MIAVIIPTLNEEEAIGEVVRGFPDEYRGHEVKKYVIDGRSTDSTVEKAKEAGAEVLHQRLGGGKGNAVREALGRIDAEYFLMIDGDGTYDPEEMDRLMDPLLEGGAEHVIGKREPERPGAIPHLNRFGNEVFNMVTRFSTGESVHDMLSGYRSFTAESVRQMDFTRPGFGIETEMTFSAIENHVTMEEVPITYRRRRGESKLHPLKDGWKIINTIIWSIRDMNPLKFFSAASLVLLVAASYPGYLTVMQKIRAGKIYNLGPALFTSLLVILAFQMFIFGLLADQIRNTEKRLKERMMR
ncbi:MAG: glycosyltransferase [Candidatus Nanohaloarchaea archaeon]